MFVPGNAGPLCAFQKNCPMTRLLSRAKHLKVDARKERKPRFLRGVDVDILELLVVCPVAYRLVAGHALLPLISHASSIGNITALQVTLLVLRDAVSGQAMRLDF